MIYTSEQLIHDVHKGNFEAVNLGPLHDMLAPAEIRCWVKVLTALHPEDAVPQHCVASG